MEGFEYFPERSPFCTICAQNPRVTKFIVFTGVCILVIFFLLYASDVFIAPYTLCYIPTQEKNFKSSSSSSVKGTVGQNWYKYSSFQPKGDADNVCAKILYDSAEEEIRRSVNLTVNPCDDFYAFACQGWAKGNPRPSHQSEWSVFSKSKKRTIDVVFDILKKPIQINESLPLVQAKTFLQSCMNIGNPKTWFNALDAMWTTLEEYGGWPILSTPGSWNTSEFNWAESIIGLKEKFDTAALIDFRVLKNQENKILLLAPASTLIQMGGYAVDIYLKNFIMSITKELLELQDRSAINTTYLEEQASEIIAFHETVLNTRRTTMVDAKMENVTATFGFTQNQGFIALSILQDMLNAYVYPETNKLNTQELLGKLLETNSTANSVQEHGIVFITDINYFMALSKVLSEASERSLANYLHFVMAYKMAPLTTARMHGYWEVLHQKLEGTKGTQEKYRFCVEITYEKYYLILEYMYVKDDYMKTFSSNNDMEEAKAIIWNVGTTLIDLISGLSVKNVKKADMVRKVANMVNCTNSDWTYKNEDILKKLYHNISFSDTTFAEQVMALNKLSFDQAMDPTAMKSINVSDESKCMIYRSESKLLYSEDEVERYFGDILLGIPQAPYFSSKLARAFNYGKIGSLIGHKFAADITGDTVWPDVSNESFSRAADCLVNQYNQYTTKGLLADNVTVNGKLTLKENIQDNLGILSAYIAMKRFTTPKTVDFHKVSKGVDSFNDDQLFFLGFAQNWCQVPTPKHMRNTVEGGLHVPNMFRVFGALQNSNEFAKSWKCQTGTVMNPTPIQHNKCSLF